MKKTLHFLFIAFLLAVIVNPAFAQNKADIAKQSLLSKKGDIKLTSEDILNMKVSSLSYSKKSGLTHIYFQQQIDNIPIHNAILGVHLNEQNEVATINSRFVKDAGSKGVGNKSGSMTAEEALDAAAAELGYKPSSNTILLEDIGGPTQKKIFENAGYSLDPIPVELVYQIVNEKTGETQLAWEVTFVELNQENWWCARVDATTGGLLDKNNFMVNCNHGMNDHSGCQHTKQEGTFLSNLYGSFLSSIAVGDTYNVFAFPIESPLYGSRSLEVDPADGTASPFGWHDTDGLAGADHTITRGNNVWAQEDRDGNNGIGHSPDGTAALHFDFPFDPTQAPIVNEDAAITNLFYWNNILHDFLYEYGFDEVAGNFQENNYGNGGLGNDFVFADAQNTGNCNANFGTPPDGLNPRMQMFTCNNTNPAIDGDFDNEVIAHEYGHGVSNRLTGGPNNTGCLNNAEQMGEGWSDWLSLMITWKPSDVATTPRGTGEYLFGQGAGGPGIRPTPYTTDMGINPTTYGSISGLVAPHGVGYAWATMLWDLNWALIDAHGTTVGFDLSMNLVMLGMKLQPCSPGFVDGRDAIIAADVAMNGGANQCLIWQVFARRGLGFSASQGSSNSKTDGTEAFDLPPLCILLPSPIVQTVCSPDDAIYTIAVGDGFVGTMTLSASGAPAGTTVTFSPNPVPLNGNSTMTISNTGAATAGTYTFEVKGNAGGFIKITEVGLSIFHTIIATPTLIAPVDLATNTLVSPILTWVTDPNTTTYDVEVATDAGFTDIVAAQSGVVGSSWMVHPNLNPLSVYFWRVRGVNPCGTGSYSSVWTFETGNIACGSTASANVPIPISSSGTPTVTSLLEIPFCGKIQDLQVTGLDISHTWTGDLDATLTSPSGTVVKLFDRPGVPATTFGCAEDDLLVSFDDAAVLTALDFENTCNPGAPTISGVYQPIDALAVFIGEAAGGNWTLTVTDYFSADGGSINAWNLDICYVPEGTPITCYFDSDTDGYGDPNNGAAFCDSCPAGWVLDNNDCDDTSSATYPGAATNDSATDCMKDSDGDGYGDDNPPAGVIAGTDCDDNNHLIYPEVVISPLNTTGYQISCGGSVPPGEGLQADPPYLLGSNYSSSSPLIIPINPAGTFSDVIAVPESFSITDLNVDLQITHTWIGDLKVVLTAPDGITQVQLFDQPGGSGCSSCSGDNMSALFDDSALLTATDLENTCNNEPAISGSYQPIDPLSIFNGLDAQGDWTLTVTDACGADGGQVDSWTLQIGGYNAISWWDAPAGGNQVAASSPFDPTSIPPVNGGVDPGQPGVFPYWAEFNDFPACATNERVRVDFTVEGLVYNGNVAFYNQAQVDAWDPCYTIINGNVTIQGAGINDLSPLQNITSITGNLTIQTTGLGNLNGLGSLGNVGGGASIIFNPSLSSLAGLESLATVGANFYMYYNFALNDCCAIYGLINGGVTGPIIIFYNKIGCNTVAQINANCAPAPPPLVGGSSNQLIGTANAHLMGAKELSLFPNPANHEVNVLFDRTVPTATLRIMDMLGRVVYEMELEEGTERLSVDLNSGQFENGLYLVTLLEDGVMRTGQLVVQQ